MKSWRERIAEAEERRLRVPMVFTEDDKAAILNPYYCMLGEAAERLGKHYIEMTHDRVMRKAEGQAMIAVRADDLRIASRALDAIEDRALQLKREASS